MNAGARSDFSIQIISYERGLKMSGKENLLEAYGIRKESDEKKVESLLSEATPDVEKKSKSRPVTIMMHGSSYHYCKLRAKELQSEGIGNGRMSDFLEWLISSDKSKHAGTASKAMRYYELDTDTQA